MILPLVTTASPATRGTAAIRCAGQPSGGTDFEALLAQAGRIGTDIAAILSGAIRTGIPISLPSGTGAAPTAAAPTGAGQGQPAACNEVAFRVAGAASAVLRPNLGPEPNVTAALVTTSLEGALPVTGAPLESAPAALSATSPNMDDLAATSEEAGGEIPEKALQNREAAFGHHAAAFELHASTMTKPEPLQHQEAALLRHRGAVLQPAQAQPEAAQSAALPQTVHSGAARADAGQPGGSQPEAAQTVTSTPTASAVAPLQTPVAPDERPMAPPAIPARVVEVARRRSGVTEHVVVRLDPPELGAVRVSLTARGDQVHVVVRAETPEARAALDSQRDHVETLLRNEGFDLSSFDVGHQRREQEHARPRQTAGQAQAHFDLDATDNPVPPADGALRL